MTGVQTCALPISFLCQLGLDWCILISLFLSSEELSFARYDNPCFNILISKFLFQEYIQDGIDWNRVDFEDNQDCLNLFEKVQRSLMCPFMHTTSYCFCIILLIRTIAAKQT